MIDLIKWFWNSINFRAWTFEGTKMVNPAFIVWKIVFIIPVYVTLGLFCIMIAIFNLDLSYLGRAWNNNR